ncbi:MAG: hypothetical protein F6K00_00460 [Leptolyngbya sp. SIOISBB]|nr:hypothetical protein [Leptolyngbya sp. SIOISBB]
MASDSALIVVFPVNYLTITSYIYGQGYNRDFMQDRLLMLSKFPRNQQKAILDYLSLSGTIDIRRFSSLSDSVDKSDYQTLEARETIKTAFFMDWSPIYRVFTSIMAKKYGDFLREIRIEGCYHY